MSLMDRRTASHKALVATSWTLIVVVGVITLRQLPLFGWLMLLGLAAVFACRLPLVSRVAPVASQLSLLSSP